MVQIGIISNRQSLLSEIDERFEFAVKRIANLFELQKMENLEKRYPDPVECNKIWNEINNEIEKTSKERDTLQDMYQMLIRNYEIKFL